MLHIRPRVVSIGATEIVFKSLIAVETDLFHNLRLHLSDTEFYYIITHKNIGITRWVLTSEWYHGKVKHATSI